MTTKTDAVKKVKDPVSVRENSLRKCASTGRACTRSR